MRTEAQKRATNKYRLKNYDQIAIRIKKGKRECYNQLVEIKHKPLSVIITDYLEEECKKSGIDTTIKEE